jgi:hypothetical protein
MKRSQFASLCGVSKQMIAKYAAGGFIVEADGQVDAGASLALLEGRLDETKRAKALAALGASPAMSPKGQGAIEKSARAQRDEVDLELKRLQYGREAGELVSVEDVDAASREAVASLREAFANRKRDIAQDICITFGLAPEKATPMTRFLNQRFEEVMGVFARDMAALANPVRGPEPTQAPQRQPETAAAV